jgi:hypothetical protein
MQIAEVDGNASGLCEFSVVGHCLALIVGEAEA